MLSEIGRADLVRFITSEIGSMPSNVQARYLEWLSLSLPEVPWTAVLEGGSQGGEAFVEGSPIGSGPALLPDVSSGMFFDSMTQERWWDPQLSSLFEENPELRKTMYWAAAVFQTLAKHNIPKAIPGLLQLMVGFLDPAREADAFGVIALSQGVGTDDSVRLEDIRVAGIQCPIFIRPVEFLEHGWPMNHLLQGTAACWAMSRVSSQPRFGVLTAKHVLSVSTPRIGQVVRFRGGTGKVLDLGPEGIDAGIVESPEAAPGLGATINVLQLVPPWLDVEFAGAVSGLRQA